MYIQLLWFWPYLEMITLVLGATVFLFTCQMYPTCLINALMSLEMFYATIWAHMPYTYRLGNTVDNKAQFSSQWTTFGTISEKELWGTYPDE